jgi:hypothetical protein
MIILSGGQKKKKEEKESAKTLHIHLFIRSPLHRLQCRKAISVVWSKAPR